MKNIIKRDLLTLQYCIFGSNEQPIMVYFMTMINLNCDIVNFLLVIECIGHKENLINFCS